MDVVGKNLCVFNLVNFFSSSIGAVRKRGKRNGVQARARTHTHTHLHTYLRTDTHAHITHVYRRGFWLLCVNYTNIMRGTSRKCAKSGKLDFYASFARR